ncbi:DUF1877 family protein [Leucobacter sp. 1207-22]|uniref:DUF1877 family protein n=1 Tax=Leucobacter sp. 1207-22 TaxID=2604456 RepID=UPI0040635623
MKPTRRGIRSPALSPAGSNGPWPARGVIGGARDLQEDEEESWITHLNPSGVAEVAAFLADLTDDDFAAQYRAMPEELRNPEYGDQEAEYALGWLGELRTFFSAAQAERAHVVFTVAF